MLGGEIISGRRGSGGLGGWMRRSHVGGLGSDQTIERGEIRYFVTKPEDPVAKELYIGEGTEGRDHHSAEQGEQQEKEKREGQVVRPLKSGRHGSPGNHGDKDMKRKYWCLLIRASFICATPERQPNDASRVPAHNRRGNKA
jgi:hypothetical protein